MKIERKNEMISIALWKKTLIFFKKNLQNFLLTFLAVQLDLAIVEAPPLRKGSPPVAAP